MSTLLQAIIGNYLIVSQASLQEYKSCWHGGACKAVAFYQNMLMCCKLRKIYGTTVKILNMIGCAHQAVLILLQIHLHILRKNSRQNYHPWMLSLELLDHTAYQPSPYCSLKVEHE